MLLFCPRERVVVIVASFLVVLPDKLDEWFFVQLFNLILFICVRLNVVIDDVDDEEDTHEGDDLCEMGELETGNGEVDERDEDGEVEEEYI